MALLDDYKIYLKEQGKAKIPFRLIAGTLMNTAGGTGTRLGRN